jgi:peptidyl-dipeptidase Dcp
MSKFVPVVMAVAALALAPASEALARKGKNKMKPAANPLLAPWAGPFGGVPPWDRLDLAYFKPAFVAAIAEEKAEIARIAADPQPASFENTIEALERAGRTLERVDLLFSVVTENLSTPKVQALDREVAPMLAAASDEIIFNPALFARLAAVYEKRASIADPEARRLAERRYEAFVRAGARLDAKQKARLGEINQELATTFSDFSAKVLADENTWIVLEKEADLAGLPQELVSSYRLAAEERNLPGKWVVVNTRSSVDPFLTLSTRRDLREKVWRAFTNRGDNGNANDTNALIAKIVALRAERAKLLGFATHAHWRMDDTMAKDPKAAQALMMRVWPAAKARAAEEVADMQALASQRGEKLVIEPWDYRFYAEHVRKARYALDEAELKPYFQLEQMMQAAFWTAEQLYGLTFTEISGEVPVFHKDVRVWQVKDKATGAHVGLFYGDYFARAGKRSGAWAQEYRDQRRFEGPVTTITSNNNNFIKGAPGEPVLISLDDARTLFHEFGHALHGLLQDVKYGGLSGTPRDFVEYPSQVNENWLLTPQVLSRFARHVKTGAPIPQALLEKVKRASKFNQGFATVEYLSSAIVDMELHMAAGPIDADRFEKDTLARLGMPREIAMRHRLPHFNHLFSSDTYSAGYYSYLWSEVMDADTWRAFEEAGDPFDRTIAAKLRKYILSNGNSIDRAEAYRLFRGRDPDVKPLLDRRGFPSR